MVIVPKTVSTFSQAKISSALDTPNLASFGASRFCTALWHIGHKVGIVADTVETMASSPHPRHGVPCLAEHGDVAG